jgi:hypothetical protein
MKPQNAYIGKEWQFQIAAMNLIKHLWPNCTAIHVENEGRRTPQAGAISKKMGLTAGVPDIMIFTRSSHFAGLAIELKVYPNKPTADQVKFMDELEQCGWLCCVAYGLDEVQNIIKEYRK